VSPGGLAADFVVAAFGAVLCVSPAMTRPTLQFGVRVPGERVGAAVIRRQRRVYYWRTAAVGVCCTAAAVLLQGHGSWWLARVILLVEVAADLGCFLAARSKVAAAKNAGGWFAGRRQVVATDTSWRTDPPEFPVLWLVPAVAVVVATVIIGAVRYPGLPSRLAAGFGLWGIPGHRAAKSPVTVFAAVAGQAYVTLLWTGVMLLIYRSRPDIEAADAAASTRRYRSFLGAVTRAVLTLVALVDLSLLLAALGSWQVWRLPGITSALPLVPFMAGLLVVGVVAVRAGQGGSRLPRGDRPGPPAAVTDRDDDRFWKAGLIYVNRDDPALMVGNRFGVGWTFNLGNPIAWLVIAGILAAPAGLAAITVVAGR
jgi:uncharacterized membrane protein